MKTITYKVEKIEYSNDIGYGIAGYRVSIVKASGLLEAVEEFSRLKDAKAWIDLAERKAITDRWDARIAAGQNIIIG
jgi:hypothetical protein